MLDLYTLDIPNKEVRLGLMESLLPYYVNNKTPEATTMVAYLFYDIQNGDMDAALHRLQEFLSTIPYCDNTRFEGHYQQVFISYSVCWGIMWMWKFVLLVDG